MDINPTSPLTGCVTSGKLLHLSQPQLSHLQNRGRNAPQQTGCYKDERILSVNVPGL